MSELNFNWKFKNFEICVNREKYTDNEYRYDNDSPVKKDYPVELVKWGNFNGQRSCWTVAYFIRGNEGYYFKSVGNRLFDDIDENEISDIWRQLKSAQKMLDEYYLATEWEDD